MASDFETAETAALETILATMGLDLIHTDADGIETSCTGELIEDPPQIRDEPDGQAKIRTARGLAAAADLAAIARGDTIAAAADDADAWAVDTARLIAGGSYWDLRLTRPETLAKSRQRFRLER